MDVTLFTSTRGYVDRDEVVLPWVRQSEAFVLREGNKCCLPRNGLLSGDVSKRQLQFTWGWGMLTSETEMAEETASLNSRVSGLAVSGMKHDRSCRLWMVRPPESTKMPSSLQYGISEVLSRLRYRYHAETHRSLVIALPSDQLRSGLNDPSIDACTMGTLRKSSPNIRRKGMKTP
jgi:hypothetical protein